jgi:phospholipid/cholesterol/gamma-HCH transport system substrate-binding protein
MRISKEAKIGGIVVTGIAFLFWGINYLKGRDFFTSQKLVYAVYDRVDGVSRSNPVLVNGLQVGRINSLVLMPDHSGRIVIAMHLESKMHIPRNSVAEIYSRDILGTKAIQLILGDSPEDIRRGDTLVSAIQPNLGQEVSAQVRPIKEKTENLIASLDSVLGVVRSVFNEGTKEHLRQSFASIAGSLESLQHLTATMDTVLGREGRLRSIFTSLETITATISRNNDKIANMINNFSSISDTLARANIAATIENTRKTLDETHRLFSDINAGKGTLGQLAANDSLYHHLDNSARDLDLLLKDLRENPKRYVSFSIFGGKKASSPPGQ